MATLFCNLFDIMVILYTVIKSFSILDLPAYSKLRQFSPLEHVFCAQLPNRHTLQLRECPLAKREREREISINDLYLYATKLKINIVCLCTCSEQNEQKKK